MKPIGRTYGFIVIGLLVQLSRPFCVPHWGMATGLGALFDADVASGFHYRNDFITHDEEASLADQIARLEFSLFEMRGVVARRRVAFFGRTYDSGGVHATSAGVSHPCPRQDRRVGARGCGRVRDGAGQRVSTGRTDWLASRRATIRHRRRPSPSVVVSPEVSPVRLSWCEEPAPADRDARGHARAAIGIPDDWRVEECLRASHSSGHHAPLFDNLPYRPLNRYGRARALVDLLRPKIQGDGQSASGEGHLGALTGIRTRHGRSGSSSRARPSSRRRSGSWRA